MMELNHFCFFRIVNETLFSLKLMSRISSPNYFYLIAYLGNFLKKKKERKKQQLRYESYVYYEEI